MSNGSPPLSAGDMRFLVEFRDYINSAAYPASGGTIAFSTLVSDAGQWSSDARVAYPAYRLLASRLRASLRTLRISAMLGTLSVAILGAYVYWGNAVVASASSVTTQQEELAKDIAREEATGVTRLDYTLTRLAASTDMNQLASIGGVGVAPAATAPSSFLGLCDAIAKTTIFGRPEQVFLSSTQEYLCARYTDLSEQLQDSQLEAANWYSFSRHLLPYQPKSLPEPATVMRMIPYELSVINGYAIPLLMGFLGSTAYILRSFLQRLGDRVLTTRDLQSNRVRLVLGTVSGLAVGFFLSPSGSGSGSGATDTLGLGISLTAPALAFLAGYAVDVLFRFLDTLAGRAFAVK